jgi:large subunit ribosomal protein LP2
MRYIAAYLLAVLGGHEHPTEAEITKILTSVGVEVDAERLSKVIAELKDKHVDEVIAAGSGKLAKFGGAAPAAAGGAAPAGGDAAAAKEEKKEEVEEEEADLGGGMDMFGAEADY